MSCHFFIKMVLDTTQHHLLKVLVVTDTPFGEAKHIRHKVTEEPAFAQSGASNTAARDQYKIYQRSFNSYAVGSRSHWVPLKRNEIDLEPTWLGIRKLTSEEYRRQATPAMSRPPTTVRINARAGASGSSIASIASQTSHSVFEVHEDTAEGHLTFDGTFEDMLSQMSPKEFDEFVANAKTLGTGKNFNFQNLWLYYLPSLTTLSLDNSTEGFVAALFNVGVDDYKEYKLAYGGVNNDTLFLQVVTITYAEKRAWMEFCGDIQTQTTGVIESARNKAFGAEVARLNQIGSKVRLYHTIFFNAMIPSITHNQKLTRPFFCTKQSTGIHCQGPWRKKYPQRALPRREVGIRRRRPHSPPCCHLYPQDD
jgi:hypothetical protein